MRLATVIALFLALAAATGTHAQTPGEELKALQDNSFLLEEGYNNEPWTIQHIGLFIRDTEHDTWQLRFTQEFGFASQQNQFSYTIPVRGNGDTELGDIQLNYRYQLSGSSETTWAVAPRVSIILGTGEKDLGDNENALEFLLPVSKIITPRLVSHTNFGAHFDTEEDLLKAEILAGQSFIYAFSRNIHFMLEAALTEEGDHSEIFISPGVRFGFMNVRGFQVVGGVAAPIGVGGTTGENSVLGYFSVTNPFGRHK